MKAMEVSKENLLIYVRSLKVNLNRIDQRFDNHDAYKSRYMNRSDSLNAKADILSQVINEIETVFKLNPDEPK